MKKQFLNIVGAIAIGSFLFLSCSDEAKETTENSVEHMDEGMTDGHEHEHEHAAMYQCPMDCEDGKTYNEPGTCPVCNMDLVEMEHNH